MRTILNVPSAFYKSLIVDVANVTTEHIRSHTSIAFINETIAADATSFVFNAQMPYAHFTRDGRAFDFTQHPTYIDVLIHPHDQASCSLLRCRIVSVESRDIDIAYFTVHIEYGDLRQAYPIGAQSTEALISNPLMAIVSCAHARIIQSQSKLTSELLGNSDQLECDQFDIPNALLEDYNGIIIGEYDIGFNQTQVGGGAGVATLNIQDANRQIFFRNYNSHWGQIV